MFKYGRQEDRQKVRKEGKKRKEKERRKGCEREGWLLRTVCHGEELFSAGEES